MTNNDLAQIVDTNDEWIRSRTGIGERRIATTESTSYMAAKAAMGALEQSGLKPEEIDLILLGTSSPDYCFPNGACEVQGMIGAVNAACYDISAACTGFCCSLHWNLSAGQMPVRRIHYLHWAERTTGSQSSDGFFESYGNRNASF